jgi:hypothetical protein
MNKEELAKLVLTEEEIKHIDYALPQNFLTDAENLLGLDYDEVLSAYVWSYNENMVMGAPLNLINKFFQKYILAPELIIAVREHLKKAMDDESFYKSLENNEEPSEKYARLYDVFVRINESL